MSETGSADLLAALAKVEMFKGSSPQALADFAAQAELQAFQPGGVLMRQGDVSESIHVIVRGRVRVERTRPRQAKAVVVAELGAGEVVGELGALDKTPRTATVVAVDPTETLEVSATTITNVLRQHPEIAVALLRRLSRGLRAAHEAAEELALLQSAITRNLPRPEPGAGRNRRKTTRTAGAAE